jgi:hypothetical protein
MGKQMGLQARDDSHIDEMQLNLQIKFTNHKSNMGVLKKESRATLYYRKFVRIKTLGVTSSSAGMCGGQGVFSDG